MKNNVFNLADYRAKFDAHMIVLGDLVKWRDYTGDILEGRVKGIKNAFGVQMTGVELSEVKSVSLDFGGWIHSLWKSCGVQSSSKQNFHYEKCFMKYVIPAVLLGWCIAGKTFKVKCTVKNGVFK